jgi:hypothetical protein
MRDRAPAEFIRYVIEFSGPSPSSSMDGTKKLDVLPVSLLPLPSVGPVEVHSLRTRVNTPYELRLLTEAAAATV